MRLTFLFQLYTAAEKIKNIEMQDYILKEYEVESNGIVSFQMIGMEEKRMQFMASLLRTGETYDSLWKIYLSSGSIQALADWVNKPLLNEIDTRGLEDELQHALAKTPDFPWLRRAMGLVAWSQGKPEQAIEHLIAAANHFENDPQGRFALAETLMATGQRIKPDLVMGPEPARTNRCPDVQAGRYYLYLGRLWESLGDGEKLIDAFKKSLNFNPAEVEAAVRLGQAAGRAGNEKLAKSCRKYADAWKIQFDKLKNTHHVTPNKAIDWKEMPELAAFCDSVNNPALDPVEDAELIRIVNCPDFISPYPEVGTAWRIMEDILRGWSFLELQARGDLIDRIKKKFMEKHPNMKFQEIPEQIVFLARPRRRDQPRHESIGNWTEESAKAAPNEIQFEEKKYEGLDFIYQSHQKEHLRIADVMGGGVAVIDYDNDGWPDLYFPNGCDLDALAAGKPGTNNRLYRNVKGEHFEDVTTKAGVSYGGYAMGVAVGDYNADGHTDMIVTGYGKMILYKNKGDGTFVNATESAGLKCDLWTTAAAFADLDQDGDEDLFVVTYVDAPLNNLESCQDQLTKPIHCSPSKFQAQPDRLWENLGNGKFRDVSIESGITSAENGRGLGLAVADLDQDGRLDLFVANDASPNFYFHNEGGLKFKEMAHEAGLAVDGSGRATASMGVVAADLDDDGLIDIFHTNFINEPNTFRKNLGNGLFMDATLGANLSASSLAKTGFGATSFDANLDGRPDLFITNGHLDDQPWIQTPMAQTPLFYQGLGRGKFQLMKGETLPYLNRPTVGRGMAACDINNDGLVDLVIVERDKPATILMNRSKHKQSWAGLELKNRNGGTAFGAKVELQSNGRKETRWITPGTSYLAAEDHRIVFGADSNREPNQITITWPGHEGKPGKVETLKSLKPGLYHPVREMD